MRKSDLIQEATALLRESGARKPVRLAKHILHVSDDDGNSQNFVIKQTDRKVQYTNTDVRVIFEAILLVIYDNLKRGEKISVSGFGNLGLVYRKGRTVNLPDGSDTVDVQGRFVPKLSPGKNLKLCSKLYELSLSDHKEEMIDEDDQTLWDDDE